MKITPNTLLSGLLVSVIALAFLGCGPSANVPGSNNHNASPNVNASATPTATATSTPGLCDDNAVNQKLVAAFQAEPAFNAIKTSVAFYSRNCTVYLLGFTKSFPIYKKFERMAYDNAKTVSATSINSYNLVIDSADYPPGLPPTCEPGWKPCGDICIPDGEPCFGKQ